MALAKSASHDVIASEQQLADLVRQIQAADRVALDTEADSLHSYREKLCLIQISVPSAVIQSVCDFIVDPLSNLDLEPMRYALEPREIILHAADYDLRMAHHKLARLESVASRALFTRGRVSNAKPARCRLYLTDPSRISHQTTRLQ